MPEPVRGGQRYLPGLDGLRALAVLAVVAYHVGLSWVPGGLLGVGIFFTLSGYLITDLLLGQKEQAGRLQMLDFWQRRARRLLPALFVMLAVVICWVALASRSQLPALRGAVAAAALYVSNWWLIGQHSSYFANFGPQSPLGHLWSLAVEEQFYLLWPWLVYLGLRLTRARRPGSGEYYGLAAAAMAVAAGSALAMGMLYHPGYDPTRVYDGTDTRAFALLLGAALAFAWPSRNLRRDVGAAGRWCLDGVGLVGLLVIAALIWRTTEYSAFLYPGGMVVLSLATVLVIAAVTVPGGRIGQLLGVAPLRWIGVRSYGIYLWQTPVIVLTSPQHHQGQNLLRDVLQVAAILVIASLSWKFVEEPIRHGAIGRLLARRRRLGWNWATFSPEGRIVLVTVSVLFIVAIAGMVGLNAAQAEGEQIRVKEATAAGTKGPVPLTAAQAADSQKTSCKAVVHIGDSTSEGLDSAEYLPNPKERIPDRYAEVGVKETHMEVQGARSIEERFEEQPNAQEVAEAWKAEGYKGCWVLALGTNEAADVAAGSSVGLSERIEKMMNIIGDEPVLWVNVRTLPDATEFYSEEGMKKWDEELETACLRYPSMRIYNWAADVKNAWFIEDGIHFTSPGYAARAELIAHALAHAFPGKGKSPGGAECVVT
ncbi:MAG TPA: acyltransferase family protein [Streptosporangiaceae bacterium]